MNTDQTTPAEQFPAPVHTNVGGCQQGACSARANPIGDLTKKVILASKQFMGEEARSTAHRRVFYPDEAFKIFDRPVNEPLAREQLDKPNAH